MPIYEFLCGLCSKNYEIISLRVEETISTLCPYCNGEGQKLISAPAIVYEIFSETAIHRLPGWKEKMKRYEARDRRIKLPPLPHDRGQDIKVYHAEFGHQERKVLERKAQLDNMG